MPKPIDAHELLAAIAQQLKLEWQYKTSVEPSPSANSDTSQAQAMVAPPADILESLLDLVRKGQIYEIREQLEQIDRESDRYSRFTNELMALAKKFKIKEIKLMLEQLS